MEHLYTGYEARKARIVCGHRRSKCDRLPCADVGCGSGPLSAALRDRGALMTGIDASAGMPQLARQRLDTDVDLQVADLASPLPFSDNSFDDVVASLVLHYFKDWGPTLAELRPVR